MKWKRLEGAGLLRGLAIFFVLMNHVNMRLRLAKVPYTAGLLGTLVARACSDPLNLRLRAGVAA